MKMRNSLQKKQHALFILASLAAGLVSPLQAQDRDPSANGHGSHLFSPAGDSLRRGTGELGQLLGIPKDSAVTLGGEWIGNGSTQMSGGWIGPYGRQSYGQAGFIDLRLNAEKARFWKGGEVWVQGLQYNVLNNGNNASGSVQQFNNLLSAPPFTRTELYTYGLRQKLVSGQVEVSLGKLFAGYYFGAVARPIPDQNKAIAGGANTNLLFLPPYSQPTFVGREPGYPDSTLGGVLTLQPNALAKKAYLTVGVFDGRTGLGPIGTVATGMETGGDLRGPLLTMAEMGSVWSISQKQLPGSMAIGMWSQSGRLTTPCSTIVGNRGCAIEERATGIYGYTVQTLSAFTRAGKPGKIMAFLQGGGTSSRTNMVNASATGGLEIVGAFSGRENDSYGVGISWAKLNDSVDADWGFNKNELMLQATARFQVWGQIYAQPVMTWLPRVGFSEARNNGTTFTLQLSTSF